MERLFVKLLHTKKLEINGKLKNVVICRTKPSNNGDIHISRSNFNGIVEKNRVIYVVPKMKCELLEGNIVKYVRCYYVKDNVWYKGWINLENVLFDLISKL